MTQEYEKLKLEGNQHFVAERYKEASDCYTAALKLQPRCHLLYSNRSASYNKLGRHEEALTDAIHCISIAPQFARGHLRKATVLNELGKHSEAMAAAEEGYKLRGSDKVCKDCVSQWLKASTALIRDDIAKMKDIPLGTSPVTWNCVNMLSKLQVEHSSPSGVSVKFMGHYILEVVSELEAVVGQFGHSLGSCAQLWATAISQALKADPRTHLPSAVAMKNFSSKSDQFISYLSSDIDPALYPIARPILALAVLSILTCVTSLSRVISSRDTIQYLIRTCLPFFEKSILSGKQYIRLHIDALQQLLNSYCMESGHANLEERRERERKEVQELMKKLESIFQQYPPSADDYSDVKKSTIEILENSSILLSPVSSQSTKPLTKDDAEIVKHQVTEEEERLHSVLSSGKALNFRDMDALILATGGLVHLGELQKGLDVLKLSESLYFRVIAELFESQLLSLSAEALFHPQTMMHANALFLAKQEDTFLVNVIIRWKCLFSELYAILLRLGVGKCLMNTFQRIEHLKVNAQEKLSQGDVLADIGDQHQKGVKKVLKEWGPKVVQAISSQTCEELQKQLSPEQVILEYCMVPLYDTKCHPVPIPPKYIGPSGVVILMKSEGGPVVTVLDFGKIQDLALKTHNSAMKAVAARRARRSWHELQVVADTTANSLLQAILPANVQSLISSLGVRCIYFCPDQLLAKVPIEMLPFGDGTRLGEKYSIAYLSSAKELVRDNIVTTLKTAPRKSVEKSAKRDVVFFANPNFDLEQCEATGSFSPWSQLSSVLSSLFPKPEGNVTKATSLPGSEIEINEIKYLLATTHSKALLTKSFIGDSATLHEVLNVQSPCILHFATHGFSFPELQYQYRNFWSDTKSGILLAGANTYRCSHFDKIAREAGTGELTTLAACGMALEGTGLVYLSTCRSTYGFIGRGEALMSSLAQGFRSAGAQTVIATMWPVADEVAKKLALYFYSSACKPGVNPSIALQEAKRKVQEDGYDHWYDWAAFMCIGTDVPLFASTT